MASELKPCPFCGGADLSSGGDDKFVGYFCKTCQATGPNHYGSRDWNTRPTPVAPVSPDATGKCGELVTVAWFQPSQRCCDNGWMEAMAWQEGEFSAPVVLRSQAVELLAAEREKSLFFKTAMETAQTFCGLKDKTIANLEAKLAAEIRRERDLAEKQLSEVVDRMSDDYLALKAELDQSVGVIEDRSSEYEALEAKLAAAEKALEPFVSFFNEAMKGFTEGYAERTPSDKPVLGWNNAYLLMQHFIEARATLGGKPS